MILAKLRTNPLASVTRQCSTQEDGRYGEAFCITLGGHDYLVGTSGIRVLVAEAANGSGKTATVRACPDGVKETLEKFWKRLGSAGRTVLSSSRIREWAGPPEWPKPCCACGTPDGRVACGECHETGLVTCACPCGDKHQKTCEACGGRRTTLCPQCRGERQTPIRHGWAGVALFDRKLVAQVIDDAGDGEVLVTPAPDSSREMLLAGEGWFAAVMPLAFGEAPEGTPELRLAPIEYPPRGGPAPAHGQERQSA